MKVKTEMILLKLLAVVVAVINITNGYPQTNNSPIVTIAQGQLRGSILTSRKGRPIYSFRGIRFAEPPVGELRFKLPDARKNPNRPVVVYFHAGGFFGYTGASSMHGPQYLMDKDIVLVVPNYRLSAFGFLSTGDGVLPGNYGMKDQVATLRWVKQNIAAFGGNPNSVTIAGCSAGGISVWLHMMSPMSRGLFHKGISLSGGLNTFWEVKSDPLAQAKKQAALLNCPTKTSQQIADCLRKKSAEEIVATYQDMLIWWYSPIVEYSPVIEQDSGEERFFTESPMKSLLDGNFTQIPWMTGTTKDEFNGMGLYVFNNSTVAAELYDNFEKLAPVVFMYEEGTERSRLATQDFKEFYLHNQPITKSSITDLGNLYSDSYIRYGQGITSKVVSKMSVVHHDDLIYLFRFPVRFPAFKPQDPEIHMIEKLTTLWSNFIYTGNPTPKPSRLLDNITWQRMTPENLAYLNIDTKLKMKTGIPVVNTALGRLRGSILTSRKGRTIYSFRGIRFAQPPVGELRFKLPNGRKGRRNPNRPVLVYFHSGGWFSNTGSSAVHGPQYLMDQDIVLVVPNYRLAALGDGVLPGNYGMKDQVQTLRWVKQNIAAFGGNSNSVTIAGCSVGAASIWLHMMSPMSRGLFHRGISVSPSVNTFWDVKHNPIAQARKQAALLKCPSTTSQQIADCLREKGAEAIAFTYRDMLAWAYDPVLEYTPVIEEDSGQERFLTENVTENSTEANDLYNNFEELAPKILMYEEGTENSILATRNFKEFYLHNQPLTNSSATDLGNLYSDAVIRYGQDLTSKEVSKLSNEPVYSYLFEYQGRNPTPTASKLLDNVIWQRMTPENLAYLNIGSELKMKAGMFQDRMVLWDKYFPAKP
ncbi:hypothetical protein C0J52_15734 [Blattella germanica]|nr:hypothetical protein C0J52_15734 [Blattella germanica]